MAEKYQQAKPTLPAEITIDELQKFTSMCEAAFDEIYDAIIQETKLLKPLYHRHADYPSIDFYGSGLPRFTTYGPFNQEAPRDYVGAVRLTALASIVAGSQTPAAEFQAAKKLEDFLASSIIGLRFSYSPHLPTTTQRWMFNHLVDSAVERYIHIYGLTPCVDRKKRLTVLNPLIQFVTLNSLPLRLIVPISFTNFSEKHFRLSERVCIIKIPKRLQLARARMQTIGTGAAEMVVGAATHAIISKGWSIPATDSGALSNSLSQATPSVLDEIDRFFAALRIAAGVSTGYAQIIWMPEKWARNYYCDLPPIFGTAIRRYPNHFDQFGWLEEPETVNTATLTEVRRIYNAIAANTSEGVRLALRRLNSCLTRTDDADAILDAIIGMELLLSDGRTESLSYKLRLRAGALAKINTRSNLTPPEVFTQVKLLYDTRSKIVHGQKTKNPRDASRDTDTRYRENRKQAADLLRFVLDTLLMHPEYQHPNKIDTDLLLLPSAQAAEKDIL